MFLSTPSRIPGSADGPIASYGASGDEDGAMDDPQGMRGLWAMVLLRLWEDSIELRWCGTSGVAQRAHDSAVSWFGSRDFFMVCSLAGLDGQAVLERWKAARDAAQVPQ